MALLKFLMDNKQLSYVNVSSLLLEAKSHEILIFYLITV